MTLIAFFTYFRFEITRNKNIHIYFAFSDEIPHMLLSIFALFSAILLAASSSAGTITNEREAQTWDILLTTRQTNFQIIFAKFLGSLRKTWLIPAGLLTTIFLTAVLTGNLPVLTLLHLLLLFAGPLAFFCATGQFLSLHCQRSGTASAINIFLGIFLYAILPIMSIWFLDMSMYLYDNSFGLGFLYALHPFAMVISALDGVFFTEYSDYYSIVDYDTITTAGFTLIVFGVFTLYLFASAVVLWMTVHLFSWHAPRVS